MRRLLQIGLMAGIVAWTVVQASPAQARPRRDRDSAGLSPTHQLYWEAAQALYGVGLQIRRTAASTSIAPEPGGLTQEKYNRYVKEVYLEVLQSFLTKLHGGYWRWSEGGYEPDPGSSRRGPMAPPEPPNRFDTRGKVKRAHLLLEPYLKYYLCSNIVGKIGDRPDIVAGWKRRGWCAVQAMLEAISPIYEYRGAAVTWKGHLDKGSLDVDDVIFEQDSSGNYPIIVTVAGGSRIYTLASTNILFEIRKDIDADLAKEAYRKADTLYKETLRQYHKLQKEVARTQRKLAGRHKVIFSERRFYATVAQAPAKGPIPCGSVYFLVYGPQAKRQQGYHESVQVNGVECAAYPMEAGEEDRGDVSGQSCTRNLKPGRNTITVGVYQSHDSFNYSRAEWRLNNRKYTLQNVSYTQTRRGTKLYDNSIQCVQP